MNEGKEIRFIDLFSGIGGFRFGLEKAGGFRCVWSCDWNKYANQVYAKQFGKENHLSGDIKGVDARDIPDFDLLCAGFPCQAFSVAGKRKGFEDTRGTVFFEICRIAEAKRPALLLLENVRGLLSHARGETFHTILQSLEGLGYWVEWQVLNSKHFGVPQNRQRVFIVGHLRGTGGREIFPITEVSQNFTGTQEETQGEGARIRDEHNSVSRSLRVGGSGREENLVAHTISKRYHKDGSENLIQTGKIYDNNADAGRVYSSEGIARTLKGESGGLGGKMGLYEIQPLRFLNRNQKNFDNTAMTVDPTNSTGIKQGTNIRRLTPVECERLQGFPDGWTEIGIQDGKQVKVSDTQRYKMLGNAVTTNVITFLGGRIMEAWP